MADIPFAEQMFKIEENRKKKFARDMIPVYESMKELAVIKHREKQEQTARNEAALQYETITGQKFTDDFPEDVKKEIRALTSDFERLPFEAVTPSGVGVVLKMLFIQVSCRLQRKRTFEDRRISTQHHVM